MYRMFVVLMLCLVACKKDPGKPASFHPIYDGTATALRNGVPWTAKVDAGYFVDSLHTYGVAIATFDQNGFTQEYLGLGPIYFRPSINDTLAVSNANDHRDKDSILIIGLYNLYFGSDVSTGYWGLDLSLPHKISLTYDSVSKQVSGTFEAGFLSGYDTASAPWAKPVHFTNGTFTAPLHHYQIPGE